MDFGVANHGPKIEENSGEDRDDDNIMIRDGADARKESGRGQEKGPGTE